MPMPKKTRRKKGCQWLSVWSVLGVRKDGTVGIVWPVIAESEDILKKKVLRFGDERGGGSVGGDDTADNPRYCGLFPHRRLVRKK